MLARGTAASVVSLGRLADYVSSISRSASPLSSLQKLWFINSLVTLPLTLNEQFNSVALIAAHLNAQIILVRTV